MMFNKKKTPTSSASISTAGMARSTKDWSRTPSKPLEYGLASKGDNRLMDPQTQESFFHTIQTRYLTHIGSFPSVPALDEQLSALSIASNSSSKGILTPSVKTSTPSNPDTSTLQSILFDMRKLREGLLAAARTDDFAKSAYLFITRASILLSHPESYLPSLRHLLYSLHKVNPLSTSEVNELSSYLMLHLACATNSYHDAYEVKQRFNVKDHRVNMAVRALIAGDWYTFWKVKGVVDGYKSKIMERAAKDVRKHALKCVGSAYWEVDMGFMEECVGVGGANGDGWAAVKSEFGIGWMEEDGKVIIKRKPEGRRKVEARTIVQETPRTKLAPVKEPSKPTAETGRPGLGASRWATPQKTENPLAKGGDN